MNCAKSSPKFCSLNKVNIKSNQSAQVNLPKNIVRFSHCSRKFNRATWLPGMNIEEIYVIHTDDNIDLNQEIEACSPSSVNRDFEEQLLNSTPNQDRSNKSTPKSSKSILEKINKTFGNLLVSNTLIQKPLDKLSIEDIERIDIGAPQAESNSIDSNSNKRQRNSSTDNSLNCSETLPPLKRPKIIVMSDVEEEIKVEHHLVLLLPDVEVESLFSIKHLEKLQASVNKVIKTETNPQVKFEFSGSDRGKFKFVCPNPIAKEWALNIVSKLTDIFDKPKIKAVDHGIVPKLHRASITFTDKPPNLVDLFEGIEAKNETLQTLHWRQYTKKKVQGNKTIIFIGIDETSVSALKAIGCRPYFEHTRIKINIQENN